MLYYYSRITHIVCAYFIYVKSEITLVLLGMKTFSIGGKKMIKKSQRSKNVKSELKLSNWTNDVYIAQGGNMFPLSGHWEDLETMTS